MTLLQAFDYLEEKNGRGSTILLKSYNNRGNDAAIIDLPDSECKNKKYGLFVIRVRGNIAGGSRKKE